MVENRENKKTSFIEYIPKMPRNSKMEKAYLSSEKLYNDALHHRLKIDSLVKNKYNQEIQQNTNYPYINHESRRLVRMYWLHSLNCVNRQKKNVNVRFMSDTKKC